MRNMYYNMQYNNFMDNYEYIVYKNRDCNHVKIYIPLKKFYLCKRLNSR